MKILITTFGRDEAKLNVARRDIGYEKLVIITDNPELDAIKRIKKMESITGTEVEILRVDSYNFLECFYKIGEIIEKYKNHDIRFNTSGGPKTLSGAALLMCFNKGIPAYHSEEKTYKLPVIIGASFEEKINRDERKIMKNIKKGCDAEKIKKKTGFSGRKFDILLMEMNRKGIAKMDFNGKTRIALTPIGEYFRKRM
jgi:hypothetical protein